MLMLARADGSMSTMLGVAGLALNLLMIDDWAMRR
jgi:hypothetical protein